MPKSLYRLLRKVNHAPVTIFHITNMSFNVGRKIKILAKISELIL